MHGRVILKRRTDILATKNGKHGPVGLVSFSYPIQRRFVVLVPNIQGRTSAQQKFDDFHPTSKEGHHEHRVSLPISRVWIRASPDQ